MYHHCTAAQLLLLLLQVQLLSPRRAAAACSSSPGCCQLSPLDCSAPKMCCEGTPAIDLSGRRLSALPAGAFSGLRNLSSLNLFNNILTTAALKSTPFFDLPRLRWLDLGYNANIDALPGNVFAANTELEVLKLSANVITRNGLPPSVFARLGKLTGLDLTNNVIDALPRGLFAHNPLLASIDLTFNFRMRAGCAQEFASVAAIPAECFNCSAQPDCCDTSVTPIDCSTAQCCADTGELFLDNLQLTTAMLGSPFGALRALVKVTLNNNSLTAVPSGIFSSNRQLTWVELTANRITTEGLRDDSFSGPSILLALGLANNNITLLPAGFLTPNGSDASLSLIGNVNMPSGCADVFVGIASVPKQCFASPSPPAASASQTSSRLPATPTNSRTSSRTSSARPIISPGSPTAETTASRTQLAASVGGAFACFFAGAGLVYYSRKKCAATSSSYGDSVAAEKGEMELLNARSRRDRRTSAATAVFAPDDDDPT